MSDVNLTISNTVINTIVQEKVKSAVASAMADKSETLVAELVKNIVYTKVDSDGRPSNNGYNSMPLLDYLIVKQIKESAEMAIKEWIVNEQENIKASIKKSLAKNTNKFSSMLVNKLVEDTQTSFKYRLDVHTEADKSLFGRLEILEKQAGIK